MTTDRIDGPLSPLLERRGSPVRERLTRRALRTVAAPTGVLSVVVVLLFLLTGLSVAIIPSHPAAASPGSSVGSTGATHLVSPAFASSSTAPTRLTNRAPLSLPPVGPPPASLKGVFLNSTGIPEPAKPTSISGAMVNVTNDPSINLTTGGLLGLAYTAWTNASPCANVSAYAQTEVGFVRSSSGGASWSAPVYLGNADCTLANQYANAWEPSLTSLANGTLALAYVQYNVSAGTSPHAISFGGTYNVLWDRLVVTLSYNGGLSWTKPVVLATTANPLGSNRSDTPMRPWAAAIGNTLYVTWMGLNQSLGYYYLSNTYEGSASVHLKVSTNGGGTWGPNIELPTQNSTAVLSMAMNPVDLVLPTGVLLLSYVTNYSYGCHNLNNVFFCSTQGTVEVAASANNGSTFTLHPLGEYFTTYPVGKSNPVYPPPFADPSPTIAYGASTHQLFLAFSAYWVQEVCYAYGCYTGLVPNIFVGNSSTYGVTWTRPTLASPSLAPTHAGGAYNPELAVESNGVLVLMTTFINNSYCFGSPYNCGAKEELYLTSSNNGSSFSSPILVSGALSVTYTPDGEYATMVSAGTKFWAAWTSSVCSISASNCYFPYFPPSVTDVMVSTLFTGTGTSITWLEKSLGTGIFWEANLLGNYVSALVPTSSLSVTGVPVGLVATWNVSTVSNQWGVRYAASESPSPPRTISAPLTVYENYSKLYLLDLMSNPPIPAAIPYGGCAATCWNNTYEPTVNYNMSPAAQQLWVTPGTVVKANVTNNSLYCVYGYCYSYVENLTFVAWSGTGSGSVNTTARAVSIKVTAPVNETANFQFNGWCLYISYITPPTLSYTCEAADATLLFHESGLPAGVKWNVTVAGSLGAVSTNNSTTPWIAVTSNATAGLVNYWVWSIPSSTSGLYWIPTSSPRSPVSLPGDRVVNVTFTLGGLGTADFGASFREVGLPNGTAWGLGVGTSSLSASGAWLNLSLPGGSAVVNATNVTTANGVAYYVSRVTVQPFTLNASWLNFTAMPAVVPLRGPVVVTLSYTPMYWVSVSGTPGGSVSPASRWVPQGGSLQLNESPSSGFSFIGWTGAGSGAVTTAVANPVVRPSGPLTELATFERSPTRTWNVTVSELGLPAGAPYTVAIGNRTLTGAGTLHLVGFSTGSYALGLPTDSLNASNLTRFLPSLQSTSFPRSGASLTIAADGFVNLTFATQYLLTVAAAGPGTVSPAAGVHWEAAGASVPLVATPNSGDLLTGWTGSGGPGAYTGTLAAPSLLMGGPIGETAQFAAAVRAPARTYTVSVGAVGLPSGVSWAVSVGTTGATGIASSLNVTGLNGSYDVAIPIVYSGPGTRYVPNITSNNLTVTRNNSFTVSFSTQYLLTLSAGAGGTVAASPAGPWLPAGTVVQLTASATNNSMRFTAWNGSGTGQYTGSAAMGSVTLNGPLTEAASFGPIPTTSTSGNASSGQPLAIGLLLALLIVGLIVGLVAGRRRTPPGPPEVWSGPAADTTPTYGSTEAPTSSARWAEDPSTTETPPTPAPPDYLED